MLDMRFKVTFPHPDIMPRLFIIGIQHHHSLIHVIHLIIVIWQKLDANVLSIEESLMLSYIDFIFYFPSFWEFPPLALYHHLSESGFLLWIWNLSTTTISSTSSYTIHFTDS